MTQPVGVPCQRMWDRLNKVWGEDRAVGVALQLTDYNKVNRKVPLSEPEPIMVEGRP